MTIPAIFLFGFERSGTTLLSMMVGAHPEIAVPLTVTGLWYRYADKLGSYNQLENNVDLENLVRDILDEERIRLWDVSFEKEEILAGLSPGDYGAVVRRFHTLYASAKKKPYWGNIDIATLDRMDDANRWFPEARFIHIVRDGRDVALSHATMPYGKANSLECAEHWVNRLNTNLKMGAILGPKRYMTVRYEDLIMKTESTLTDICKFLGVCYSTSMLGYTAMVDEKIPHDRRWLWPALDKPPLKSKVYGWKKRMNPAKRIVFEGSANSMLKYLGYEAYESVPKRLSAYLYELWCFLSKGGRFRRLGARFGLNFKSELERNWKKKNR